MAVTFGTGYATEFEVLASRDGAEWKTLGSFPDGKGDRVECVFPAAEANVVRVRAVRPDGPNQPGMRMSIAELEAYEQAGEQGYGRQMACSGYG